MRKRLVAIPYSACKFGVRVDWSPRFRTLVAYAWYKDWTWSYHLRDLLHLGNRCRVCGRRTLRYRYCNGDGGCPA